MNKSRCHSLAIVELDLHVKSRFCNTSMHYKCLKKSRYIITITTTARDYGNLFKFCSKTDLQNPATFRDLSKPMGALNPERLVKLLVNNISCFVWSMMDIDSINQLFLMIQC